MAQQPVITALIPPYIRGGTVQIIGEGFGRVSSVALVDAATQTQHECSFQVDTGFSIHLTLPRILLDGSYSVVLGTLSNDPSLDNSGQMIVLPDDNPPVPEPGDWSADNPIPSFSSPAYDAILARARLEAGDFAGTFADTVTADGTTNRFDLTVEAVEPKGLNVVLFTNGQATIVAAGDYTLDADLGVVTLDTVPPPGTVVSVAGSNYQFYGNTEWQNFIASAALKHTHLMQDEVAYRGATGLKFYFTAQQTIDTLPPVEYHPLAMLAAIEALWVISTDASFDISVSTAEGTSLPRQQRFGNILQTIQAKTEQYESICRQLNVGLDRIEVFTLRRTSRTTNRLVPVYRPKEFDDYSLPERIYPHRDTGRTANDTSAPDPYYNGGGLYP